MAKESIRGALKRRPVNRTPVIRWYMPEVSAGRRSQCGVTSVLDTRRALGLDKLESLVAANRPPMSGGFAIR